MPRTPAQTRAAVAKARAELRAVLNKPCISVRSREVLPTGEIAWTPSGDEVPRPRKGHKCGPECLSISIDVCGPARPDPEASDFADKVQEETQATLRSVLSGRLPLECLGEQQRICAFYKLPFPQEALDELARPERPRFETVGVPAPAAALALPAHVRASEAVLPMRAVARPRPALPAPMPVEHMPPCRRCGHEAWHHDMRAQVIELGGYEPPHACSVGAWGGLVIGHGSFTTGPCLCEGYE